MNIQNYIHSLNSKHRKTLKAKNVTYFNNYAKFEDEHSLSVGDNKIQFINNYH